MKAINIGVQKIENGLIGVGYFNINIENTGFGNLGALAVGGK